MPRKKSNNWIQKLRKGTYREQLVRLKLIKPDEDIPLEISRKICNTEVNATTRIRGKVIKVTPLLKRRACTHLTLVALQHKRKSKSKKKRNKSKKKK